MTQTLPWKSIGLRFATRILRCSNKSEWLVWKYDVPAWFHCQGTKLLPCSDFVALQMVVSGGVKEGVEGIADLFAENFCLWSKIVRVLPQLDHRKKHYFFLESLCRCNHTFSPRDLFLLIYRTRRGNFFLFLVDIYYFLLRLCGDVCWMDIYWGIEAFYRFSFGHCCKGNVSDALWINIMLTWLLFPPATILLTKNNNFHLWPSCIDH